MVALQGNSFLQFGGQIAKGFKQRVPDRLASGEVRERLGKRVFDFLAETTKKESLLDQLKSAGSSLLKKIYGANEGYGKWVGGVLKFAGSIWEKTIGHLIPDFSFQGVMDLAVEGYFELINFNWNVTDAEIEEMIKQNEISEASAKGSLAGTSLVWGIGAVVSSGVAVKWPVIGAGMALEIAEEGASEVSARLGGLIQTMARSRLGNTFLKSFLSMRRMELFGMKSVYSFQNKKPWTIANAIDEKIDSIKDPKDRAYWRAFLDAVEDSIIDMGYVIAWSLDDHFANNQFSALPPPDTERAIRLYVGDSSADPGAPLVPGADAPYIYLEGDQDHVIEQAEQIMLQNAVIGSRDIGEFMGVPYEEWQRATPKRSNLQIRYFDGDKPPFEKKGARRAVFNIPDPKPLTWEKIKQAAISYTYGPVLTTIKLDNGRQMQCWASTPSEGLNTLKKLLDLSTAKMVGFPAHTEIDDSLLPPAEKKRNVKMTAAFGTYTIARSTRGITDPSYLHSKNKKWAKNTFKIWVGTEAESGFERPLGD